MSLFQLGVMNVTHVVEVSVLVRRAGKISAIVDVLQVFTKK